jgi:LPS-assembly lipoprotein
MRHLKRLGAAAPALCLAAAMLAGCGFRPMYAASASGQSPIGPVVIDQIDGKAGHVLKAELEKMLRAERSEGPAQRLRVTVGEGVVGLGFRIDESASRSDLVLNANYTLFAADGRQAASGSVSTTASYDIPASAYGEISAQDDARERAAENLAERLRADLALRLSQARARGTP